MSAIIIQASAYPSERTPLISSDSRSAIAPPSPANDASSKAPPLKDSISFMRFVTVLIGIWSANLVFAFQSTAIPTLAPEIGSWFEHAELASYLGSMFTLANTAVIPIYGVLMEALGRKTAIVIACVLFGSGTILCALAGNMYTLIGARVFAGLGGGGLLTVSSVIVTDLVPLRDRGFYQGLMMTVFGSGSMLGGPVAGWLTDKVGWEWAFWVQLPVTVFCCIIVVTFLPSPAIPPTHTSLLSGLASLDWLGTILLVTSISALILGFSFHTSYLEPLTSPVVWGLLLVAIISAIAFLLVEMKVERPVLPLRLFKSNHLAAVMLSGFFLSIANQSFTYQIPVYFLVILGTTTAKAGLIISLCSGLGLATGSLLAGQYIRSGYPYRWLGPIALVPAVTSALIAASWTVQWPWWGYYATVFPSVLGYSTFLCVQLGKSSPKATALLYATRSLGATLGVSIGGSIQLGALGTQLRAQFKGVDHQEQIIDAILHSKSAISLLPPSLQPLALAAYSSSLSTVWLVSSAVAVLTLLCSFFIQVHHVDEEENKVSQGTGGGLNEGPPFGQALGEASSQGERH
ncbi:hypothetical protein L202_06936 [Cryptococcus amylolentus CBS 6039]|uniref:Major facilitator superfamily (MFS) profile domain-containing protein n=2 Tax=Cryptococcus amylolentus TaxID=104669 RepID=A0A1E3HE27_9TREE|nr:hypothetical protein L202_06936 [Cryptococcus amylolentus CBS 6039]ODN74574.1 hypothetical protein L202_06936 [Cryptococcus amylolentus CBS 6039]ODO01539.1 hypothetical protein I350_06359 [Cryptococcus amylolentus CBS 6273]